MKFFVFFSVFCGLIVIGKTQGFFLPNLGNVQSILSPANTVDCITEQIETIQRDVGVVVGVGNVVNDIINENLKDYGNCLSTGSGIMAIAGQFTCVVDVVGSVPQDLIKYANNFQASLGRLLGIGSAFNPCFF